jgi:rubrerythrin
MSMITTEPTTLMEILRAAYENESNTHVRYAEFAAKADGEGWHGVASLFRAAARAEDLHNVNHGRILRQLGGITECEPQPVEVHVTLDNLRAALAGEIFEIDTMYPAFLEQARAFKDVAVIRSFTWALEAEKTHARLINEAIALLEIDDEESWVTMHRDFYVCPVCGYTSESPDETTLCPVCNCSCSRFERLR